MIPLDSALRHRHEFDERWFLLPIGVVLVFFFAVVMIVMLPRSAPILVEAVPPVEAVIRDSAPATSIVPVSASEDVSLGSANPRQ